MIERLKTYFTERSFYKISVNVNDIDIFYTKHENATSIVVLLSMSRGDEFTKEQYTNIIRQIRKQFEERNHDTVHMLSLIATNYADKVQKFCEDEECVWIIDLLSKRIIRYENQVPEFLNIYKDLDNLLIKSQNQEQIYEAQDKYYNYNANENGKVKRKGLPFSICNIVIVALNVIIFLIMDLFQLREAFFDQGSLFWPLLEYNNQYYRLFTSMFIHSSISHLANNMLVLVFIGDNLERTVGKLRYLVIYFASGIIAGIVSMSYNMKNGDLVRSVGASGAIFGVVGAVAYLVIANRGSLKEISKRQILLFVALSLYGGLTSQGVDNAAHIGGLIAGVLLTAILYHLQKKGSTT